MSQLLTDQQQLTTSVDISHLVIEDDKPVDNFQSAQQQRFLVQTLYDSEALPVPFLAEANVGLFYQLKEDPIVPDVLLSLGQKGKRRVEVLFALTSTHLTGRYT